jgi:dTDP-4-amino-4,6-dideoxygalactose transaminase
VFVDVGDDYLIDVRRIEKVISKKTRAIIPVHLYGRMADMEAINNIAKHHKLSVIEDAAQAHGARFKGKNAGTFGITGCFSFYPTKNLGAYGDGGAITTDNKSVYQKLLLLRNYGWKKRYISHMRGYNSRLDELQAAILLVKLRYLDKWNARRISLASLYMKHISRRYCKVPEFDGDGSCVFHLFVIQAACRDRLKKYLEKHGVHTAIHYPAPVHLQKAFKDLGYSAGDFPVAERSAHRILSLPLYPELTDQEAVYVSKKINSFYE